MNRRTQRPPLCQDGVHHTPLTEGHKDCCASRGSRWSIDNYTAAKWAAVMLFVLWISTYLVLHQQRALFIKFVADRLVQDTRIDLDSIASERPGDLMSGTFALTDVQGNPRLTAIGSADSERKLTLVSDETAPYAVFWPLYREVRIQNSSIPGMLTAEVTVTYRYLWRWYRQVGVFLIPLYEK